MLNNSLESINVSQADDDHKRILLEKSMKVFEQNYEAFIDAFSGATGGVFASLLLYPIENFRTRVQTMNMKSEKPKEDLKEDDTLQTK